MPWKGWGWFFRANVESILQALWALALSSPLWLAFSGYLPIVGGFMGRRLKFETPVWSLFAAGLVLAALAALLVLIVRRLRNAAEVAAATAAPSPPPPAEIARPAPRKPHQLEMYGLQWEVSPKFGGYVHVENPGGITLKETIRGPFCLTCSRLIQRLGRPSVGYGDTGVYYVEDPCGKCGSRLENDVVGRIPVHKLKMEVFKEAQRLARRGELES